MVGIMSDRTVTTERTIAADPEAVWDALTTDDGFAAWNGEGATIEPFPGGRVDTPERSGAVEFVDRPTDLHYRWWPDEDPDQVSTVELTVEPAVEGATVIVIERLVLPPAGTARATTPQLLAA